MSAFAQLTDRVGGIQPQKAATVGLAIGLVHLIPAVRERRKAVA